MGSWRSWVLPLESLHLSLFSTLATTSERKCRERERPRAEGGRRREEEGEGEGDVCVFMYVCIGLVCLIDDEDGDCGGGGGDECDGVLGVKRGTPSLALLQKRTRGEGEKGKLFLSCRKSNPILVSTLPL